MRASRVKKNEVDRIRTIADLMAVTAQVYGNLAAVRIRNWKELSEQTFSGEDFS